MKSPTYPSTIPARKPYAKGILAEAHNLQTIELPLEVYYELLRRSIRMNALERHGVVAWSGYDAAFDERYDEECIGSLPAEFLD
jgi:hypothetical protein